MSNSLLRWVIFDADNTLWQVESLYDDARRALCSYIVDRCNDRSKVSVDGVADFQRKYDAELYASYGYSASRFVRSFEETCKGLFLDYSEDDIRHCRRLAEKVFEHKARPYPGVDELLRALHSSGYMLGLLTAGERWVQEKRLREFHLTEIFRGLEIVERKTDVEFRAFCSKYSVDREISFVVGDSVKSDINPALKVGLKAVWVRHPNWIEMESESPIVSDRMTEVGNITDVLDAMGIAPVDLRPRADDRLQAFGIFEGGGAKGLAHVGALSAARRRKIDFVGLAGASAGAIVAALHAVGYEPDEMFDRELKQVFPFNADWLDLIGRERWARGKNFISEMNLRAEEILSQKETWFSRNIPGYNAFTGFVRWFGLGRKLDSSKAKLAESIGQLGYFSTATFEKWFNGLLLEKVSSPKNGRTVTFGDIDYDLRIVSSNITLSKMEVHSKANCPDRDVAKAVCASIAIPVFFSPVEILDTDDRNGSLHLDGGMLSNFPAWLFLEQSAERRLPVIGFELVDTAVVSDITGGSGDIAPSNLPFKPATSPVYFLGKIASTIVSGKRQLETRGVVDLYSVTIETKASTFNFEMANDAKVATFDEGSFAAIEFFKKTHQLVSRTQMEPILYFAYSKMRSALGIDCHLRVNIMDRSGANNVSVRYSFNMDFDADEYLTFPEGAGGVGRCFQKRDIVLINLEDAKLAFKDYQMKRTHQALVRPSLRSLMCVPLFHPFDKGKPLPERRMLGVLNFDSDDNILPAFGKAGYQALDIARFVAQTWITLAEAGAI